jgi:hypothetical protein
MAGGFSRRCAGGRPGGSRGLIVIACGTPDERDVRVGADGSLLSGSRRATQASPLQLDVAMSAHLDVAMSAHSVSRARMLRTASLDNDG